MSKPLLVFQGPVSSRSGYGDHSRDLLKSLYEMDKYDVKIIPTQWGHCPQNQLAVDTQFGNRVLSNIVTSLDKKPDIFMQVSVANEFTPIGNINIGVTAGVETTVAPMNFIEGCNKMDMVIVPSQFTKQTLVNTGFKKVDQRTNQQIGEVKLEKPVEVLFEGVDLSVYDGKSQNTEILDSIPTDFNFLYVGHWLQGNLGEDRKDTGMMIKTFCTVFKDVPKNEQPGLILKTSHAGFSITDKSEISKKIEDLTKEYGDKCPPIYLVFGDLTERDLNEMYNHPKVKSFVMFTKGEGYGRPLAEFATTGKPIIVSNWSGHVDFLPKEHTVFLDGEVKPIHPSAVNDFLLKESQWFTVNYSMAAQKLFDVHKNYKKYLLQSNGLKTNIRSNFSLVKMTERFTEIMDKYDTTPEHITLDLPVMKKL
jgi:hypothetical protein